MTDASDDSLVAELLDLSRRGELTETAVRAALDAARRRSDAAAGATERLARLGTWRFDARTMHIEWSREQRRLHGVEPEAPIDHMTVFRLLVPEDATGFAQVFADVASRPGPFTYDYRIRLPDGSTRTLRTAGEAELDGAGQPIGLRGYTQEIAGEPSEREGERAERLVERLGELTPDLVLVVDHATQSIVFANGAARAFLGAELGELQRATWRSFIHADDLQQGIPEIRYERLGELRDVATIEVRARAVGGAWRWLSVRWVPFAFQPSGEPLLHAVVAHDVTERRALLAQLQATVDEATENARLADAAIDASTMGIAFADEQGRLTRVNDACLALWGYDRQDEVVGRSVVEFWTDAREAAELFTQLFEDGHWTGTLRARRRDGEERRIEVTASVFSGAPRRLFATFQDVTELELLRARLLEAQRIARLGNFDWRAGEPSPWWSDEVRRIVGLAPSEPLSHEAFLALVRPEDRPEVESARNDARSAGRAYALDYRLVRPDGSERVVHERCETSAARIWGTLQDITEKQRAEDAVRAAWDLVRTVMDGAPVVIFAMDRQGTFTLSEGRALRLLGLAPGQVVGQSALALFGGVAGFEDAFGRALGGESVRLESRVGSTDFEAVYAPRYDARGQIDGVIGVGFDVTERNRLTEQLAQSQKMQAIGLLAGGIAHDFNNLLTVIQTSASFLQETIARDSTDADDVRQILEASARASTLTRQLLTFGRRQLTHPVAFDLNARLTDLRAMLDRLIGEDVSTQLRLTPDLPKVFADPAQYEQVVINLAINARDAMPRGGELRISTELRVVEEGGDPAPGRYVALIVKDTGHGMDEATQARIFEPFFTTKAHGQGTGLGLSIAYGIVAQSGGTITVRSVAGEGTSFSVLVPVATSEQEASTVSSEVPVPVHAPKGRILLVEDEPQVRDLARRVLERAGYSIRVANDGADALAQLGEDLQGFALVVSDVVMPRMSGPDLARRAAELGSCPPFLFVSGYTADTTLRYGVEGIALLGKPFSPEALVEAVRRALERQG